MHLKITGALLGTLLLGLSILAGCQGLVAHAQKSGPEYGDEQDVIELREGLAVRQLEDGIVLFTENGEIELSTADAYRLGLVLNRSAFDIAPIGPRPGPRCEPPPDLGFVSVPSGRLYHCPPPPLQLEQQRRLLEAEQVDDLPPMEELVRVPGGALHMERR